MIIAINVKLNELLDVDDGFGVAFVVIGVVVISSLFVLVEDSVTVDVVSVELSVFVTVKADVVEIVVSVTVVVELSVVVVVVVVVGSTSSH